jgi:hypothetical protein
MPALGSQSDLPGPVANTDKDRDLVCGGSHEHESAGRKADARDNALHGLRIWGYCVPHFYHSERNHQELQNRLNQPDDEAGNTQGEIAGRRCLGGMLQYYSAGRPPDFSRFR